MQCFDTRPRGPRTYEQAARRLAVSLAVALVVILAGVPPASAQAVIKVNEDVNIRLGVLGQFQGDWLEDGETGDTPNLFIRRIRLLFGGQVAKNVSFFVDTDAPNLGRKVGSTKNITPSMIIQDAYAEFRVNTGLMINAGLMFVPFSRASVQSAGTLLALDYPPYTFAQSPATQSATGRDTGFQARGYFLGNRLEYRVGAFQGAQRANLDPALRVTGRLQYQFLEPEGTGYFYAGTQFGMRRVLALGAAFDVQDEYRGYDVDLYLDHPTGTGAITGQVFYNHFDGGLTLPSLPAQDLVQLELGYFFPGPRLTPWVQFARRDAEGPLALDETRWSVGVNYWLQRHNANVKAAFGQIDSDGLGARSQFTIQLQIFYF